MKTTRTHGRFGASIPFRVALAALADTNRGHNRTTGWDWGQITINTTTGVSISGGDASSIDAPTGAQCAPQAYNLSELSTSPWTTEIVHVTEPALFPGLDHKSASQIRRVDRSDSHAGQDLSESDFDPRGGTIHQTRKHQAQRES